MYLSMNRRPGRSRHMATGRGYSWEDINRAMSFLEARGKEKTQGGHEGDQEKNPIASVDRPDKTSELGFPWRIIVKGSVDSEICLLHKYNLFQLQGTFYRMFPLSPILGTPLRGFEGDHLVGQSVR